MVITQHVLPGSFLMVVFQERWEHFETAMLVDPWTLT